MSTGNNKEETLVTKKRKRVLHGYIHPNKPEIKRCDFFTGGQSDQGQYRMLDSKEFLATYDPTDKTANQVGCWTLVTMNDPYQGTASYQRIGMKYFLKYIKFKGHISVNIACPFTIRYKLLLIKSDRVFNGVADLMAACFSNYEPMQGYSDSFMSIEQYCRHNFYKTFKWSTGCAETRTSIMVVHSGTLTPPEYSPKPTKSSTLGSNPSYTYTMPDILRFGVGSGIELNQACYLPINVSVQVNDNVEVGVTKFYLMLCTDHGIGVAFPTYSQAGGQLYYRASSIADYAVARFNFFGISYFIDL